MAERLLLQVTPAPERDSIAGDLEEEYHQVRAYRGTLRARYWYWSQVLRSLVPGFRRPPAVPPPAAARIAPQEQRPMSFTDLRQDIRWALRGLARSPGFTAISVVTLALAIGVNSAIFSMVGVLFYADMPIAHTETFAFFFLQNPEQGARRRTHSMYEFVAYRDAVPAFEQMAGIRYATGILTEVDEPLHVVVAEATPQLWETWGTPPALGRGFTEQEAAPGAAPVALLSHGFWERQFGADPDIVGRRVRLDGHDTTIIGVMSPLFEFGDKTRIELWRPLRLDVTAAPSEQRDVFVTGRLAAGATFVQARQQAAAVAQRLEQEAPQTNRGWVPQIDDFSAGVAGDDFWPIMTMLSVTVGFVMLMACSNIASMTLARGAARAREIAVRAALGAGRWRIVRGLLTEGALLAIVAAALGLAVTRVSLEFLVWMAGDRASIGFFFRMLEIDRNVLGFTMLVAVLSPLLFSLLPALRVTRTSLVDTLKTSGGGASSGVETFRARRVLVAGQVALALSLMVVAGVLVRTVVQMRSMEPTYDPGSLLTLRVDLPESKYPAEPQQQQFFRDTIERIRALPEVETAAWTSRRPLADSAGTESFRINGRDVDGEERAPWTGLVATEPAYFDLVGVRLLRGRMFGSQDAENALPVVLVNEDVVTRYWPDEDPLGAFVQLARDTDQDRWMEVVGVVSSLPQPDPTAPAAPLFYVPLEQSPRAALALMARPRGPTGDATGAIRAAVWAVDADQPIYDVRTMEQIYDDNVAGGNAITSMFSAFAVFALVMAAAGIYGVMSVLVTQRTREFGIRMALGADSRAVRSMVVRGSAVLVLGGALVGALGGFALATLLASGLPEVDARDPLVYAVVVAVLTLVAMASLWLPTRRATRIDPLVALRTE